MQMFTVLKVQKPKGIISGIRKGSIKNQANLGVERTTMILILKTGLTC